MIVSWFSAGVSSFIATWLMRDSIDEIVYIDIADHHPDSIRFVKDCESVLGMPIKILKSTLGSVENALRMAGAVRFPHGAPCTGLLKRRVRKEFEREREQLTYIWGMDWDEKHRAVRITEAMPKQQHRFPLIEKQLLKSDAHGICYKLGVKRPVMYELAYGNNNCIGCVKGGMGYWNAIRRDFPEVFASRAKLEREIGASIINGVYLDELPEDAGRDQKAIVDDCGIFCEIEFRGAVYSNSGVR